MFQKKETRWKSNDMGSQVRLNDLNLLNRWGFVEVYLGEAIFSSCCVHFEDNLEMN